jgi:hypothetical protein
VYLSRNATLVFLERRRSAQDSHHFDKQRSTLQRVEPSTHSSLSFLVPLTQDQEPALRHGVTPRAVSIELILPQLCLQIHARRHPPAIWMSCTCNRARRASLQPLSSLARSSSSSNTNPCIYKKCLLPSTQARVGMASKAFLQDSPEPLADTHQG